MITKETPSILTNGHGPAISALRRGQGQPEPAAISAEDMQDRAKRFVSTYKVSELASAISKIEGYGAASSLEVFSNLMSMSSYVSSGATMVNATKVVAMYPDPAATEVSRVLLQDFRDSVSGPSGAVQGVHHNPRNPNPLFAIAFFGEVATANAISRYDAAVVKPVVQYLNDALSGFAPREVMNMVSLFGNEKIAAAINAHVREGGAAGPALAELCNISSVISLLYERTPDEEKVADKIAKLIRNTL